MLSSIPLVGRLFTRERAPPSARQLAAVPVHDLESDQEKRARTLKYLLKGNHFNSCLVLDADEEKEEEEEEGEENLASPITSRHRCNDVAYLLYAVYMMGGSTELLNSVYDAVLESGSDWPPSPAEIAHIDWRDFLGRPRYQHAYVDFFEDILAEHKVAYNWHTVVQQYLFGEGYDESTHMEYDEDASSDAKYGVFLKQCLLGASGAPIMHLAYAFELNSRQLAMEGLALAASTYREDVAQFLAELEGTTGTKGTTTTETTEDQNGPSLRSVLEAARNDSRFQEYKSRSQPSDATTQQPAFNILAGNLSTPEARAAFVEYWRRWNLASTDDLTPKLREAQRVFTDLLVNSAVPGGKKHDKALSSVLAVSHGVRVLLPFIPAKYHLCVMQQWWLLALSIYLDVGMPAVPEDAAETEQGKGTSDSPKKDWKYVNDKTLQKWRLDQSYMMVLCSLQAAQTTWPDEADHYLAAAVRFVDEFDGWSS